MSKTDTHKNIFLLQLSIIIVLVVAYWGLGIYFHAVLNRSVVYSHFAYIPIVLAGIWWGKRSIVIALLMGFVTFSFNLNEYWAQNIFIDAGRVVFFIVVGICVALLSERAKTKQRESQISEEKYRFLIEKSLAGIFLYIDDKIVFTNPRLNEMLGYPISRLTGMNIWNLVYADDVEYVKERIKERELQGFSDLHYECRLTRKDGSIMWADVLSSISEYEGKQAVLVNIYDITGRKKAEKEKQKIEEIAQTQEEQLVHSSRLAELGEMAASVAHELNQPLTGIRNFARNAYYMIEQSAGSSEEIADNLRLISDQVDRASRIISQMRELTRKSEQNIREVNINDILTDCLSFLESQLTLSDISVSADFDEVLPSVPGDKIRLEQVFLNLFTNARQAMEGCDKRELNVKTAYVSEQECPVVIMVSDTGKGFDQAYSERLFVPFYSTKEVGTGTGLGLSISLSIVKDHQGTIEAKGTPGKGAVFTVRLPGATERNSK